VEEAGTVIGPYKLLQKLGEGGMGTVWVAEQRQPVKRRVALKLIKPGLDSARVLRRFEAERQVLALMDHTHIAKVFDAGTTPQGRPYFVMELVHGVPITRYGDELNLPVRERLALFVPVCQAIQHAHQKGIIHRDIKPSNVLVCMQDGKPVPKVIDFGVAKALHQQLSEGSLYTEFGALVGTLEYMAPEQAEMSPLGVDTRADVYALGVLLYELLTGTTPLDRKRVRKAALAEVLRLIREEEPPKPSTRLTASKASLASVAAHRRTEPGRLAKEVRGELDWIVMKCLEKDRTRRYETANGLARDVERYLADEPVEACPPSAGYRLRKLVRRYRGPVLAGALVLLALVAGMVGTTWGLIRAEQAAGQERQARESEREQRRLAEKRKQAAEANEREALREKRIAEAVRTFLERDLLRQADPTAQANALRQAGGGFQARENPTIKELLDRAAAELAPGKIDAKFPEQPEVQASILRTVGDTYRGIGAYGQAVAFLSRSSDTYRHALGANHPSTLNTLANLAEVYRVAGKAAEAIALLERVRDASVEKLGTDHPDTLNTVANLAGAYLTAGKAAEAIALLERVRDAKVQKLGTDHPDTLTTLANLAVAYRAAGKTAEAIVLYEQVRDARVKKLGADHPDTLTTLANLATAYRAAGKTAEAIALLERVRDAFAEKLGIDHPATLTALNNLANAYGAAGKTAEAIALLERVRDAKVQKLGTDHPDTLTTLANLAGAYQAAGKTAEAIVLYEQVRDARVKKLGADHPDTLITLNDLAVASLRAGKTAEAITLLERMRDTCAKKLGPDHPGTLDNLNNLAGAYQTAGKTGEAIVLYEQVRDARVKTLGADHPATLITLNDLAVASLRAGKTAEAITLLDRAQDGSVRTLGADHPNTLSTLANLARAYRVAGKMAEAIALFERVRDAQVQKLGPDHPDTLTTLASLAIAYRAAGKLELALPLLQQAAMGIEKRQFGERRAGSIISELSACHEQLKQYEPAEAWRRKWLAVVKERAGPESVAYAAELAGLSENLLQQQKHAEAEQTLCDCLAIRTKKQPDDWLTFHTKSLLGDALLSQKKYAEAELLLTDGYEGMKQRQATIPPASKVCLTEALERLVRLAEATGKNDEAARWRKELEAARTAPEAAEQRPASSR
jgi:DNA-binding SARP family transcriptional activator/tRNA A-37 threonylcarbamoyl transferase component Bud32